MVRKANESEETNNVQLEESEKYFEDMKGMIGSLRASVKQYLDALEESERCHQIMSVQMKHLFDFALLNRDDQDLMSTNLQFRIQSKLATQLCHTHSKSLTSNLTAMIRLNVFEAMDSWVDDLAKAQVKGQKEAREAQTQYNYYEQKMTKIQQEMEAEV
jgi:hypothetical protein